MSVLVNAVNVLEPEHILGGIPIASFRKDTFDVEDEDEREYTLAETPKIVLKLTVNGIENLEGRQYKVDGAKIVFEDDVVLLEGDVIEVAYVY